MNLLYSACVVQGLKWSASWISQKQGSHPVYLEFDFDKRKLSFLLIVEARMTFREQTLKCQPQKVALRLLKACSRFLCGSWHCE